MASDSVAMGFQVMSLQETIANEQHYTELGLNSADISGALDQGTSGKKLDDLSQSVCEAVNQLTTWVEQAASSLNG